MHSSNTFNILCVAKILNLARKITSETLRKNITTKVNCNKRKKSIKIAFDMQKIMQRNNILRYY